MHIRVLLFSFLTLLPLLGAMPCAQYDAPILPPAVYPQEGQMFQRNILNAGEVVITLPYTGVSFVEARYDSAPWQTIDTDPANGVSGILSDVPVGWHSVEVREVGGSILLSVMTVGVGDIFVLDGQSNMMMQGETFNVSLFGASVLPRKVGASASSIFKPANDSLFKVSGGFGSAWPLVADMITEGTGVPVGFVAVAEGATGLVNPPNWKVGNFFWNRMITNTLTATGGLGKVTAVLKDQGETDANHSVAYADFKSALCNYPPALAAALGNETPLVVSQTGLFASVDEAKLQPIRDAQRDAALECPNVYGGFVTTDLPKNATGHYSNATIPELARRWCNAIASLPRYVEGSPPACE